MAIRRDRILVLGATSGGAGVFSSVTSSNLTEGRVVLAGAGGALTDDADLTFATDTLTATKGTFGGITHIANAIAAANSVTSATGTALTLASLDGNANVAITPHGSGQVRAGGTGGFIVPSTNTGGVRWFNTADETTNYERVMASWASNVFNIGYDGAGSGDDSRGLRLVNGLADGTPTYLRINQPEGATPMEIQITGTTSTLGGNARLLIKHQASYGDRNTAGANSFVAITPLYNQASGTAANTDLLVNRTQTAVGSGAQRLIDAQVGAVSQWMVSNVGNTTQVGSVTTGAPNTGTAAPWKMGTLVTGQVGLVIVATQYVELDISGTLVRLATV